MTNPVMVARTTSRYGDPETGPKWRTCWMWCPGCNSAKAIPVPGEDGTLPPDGPHWVWNEDLQRPTLEPSILQHPSGSVPACHSYVINGQWQFLSDCSHPLAGQSVDMVPLPDWLCPASDSEDEDT